MRKEVLQLRYAYAEANRQAAALIRAHHNKPSALIDLQGEIERGADYANAIALRAQTRADNSLTTRRSRNEEDGIQEKS